jgi:hypothetical protein
VIRVDAHLEGRLIEWSLDRASASGLAAAAQGHLVDVEGAGPALITALLRDRVELAPLSAHEPVEGARVRSMGPLVVRAEDRIGHAIDCLGNALEGPPARASSFEPVFGRNPFVLDYGERWTLGTLVVDLQRVQRTGTSVLAIGGREALLHIMRHQIAQERVCVLATPGATPIEHLRVRRGDLGCIHVAAPPDAAPAQQWLVPWSALAIASSLRAHGKHVVVVVDDLDAWRPHVLRFPVRGSWHTQLAQLASFAHATRSGSVSVIALTKGPLSSFAFDSSVDLSRVMRGEIVPMLTKLVRAPIRFPSVARFGYACSMALQRHMIDESHAFAHSDASELNARVRACLRVRPGATVDTLEQLLCLLAVIELPELSPDAVVAFVDAYLVRLRKEHAAHLARIRNARALTLGEERLFLALAAEVAAALE